MKMKVFSIRDSKGEMYNTPFYKLNDRDATFDFKRLVNDKQSLPGQYPKDYDLYALGTFDDQTGKFICLDQPQHIAEGILLIDQSSEQKAPEMHQ